MHRVAMSVSRIFLVVIPIDRSLRQFSEAPWRRTLARRAVVEWGFEAAEREGPQRPKSAGVGPGFTSQPPSASAGTS